jgi:hypothetical protein
MTTETPNPSTLKITHNDVVNIITCIIEVDGLEEAKSVYKQLNAVFSTLPGWKETATDIYKLFADKRKEEFQRQREEKLEELRESAPKFVMANTNNIEAKAVGKAEIDKMNVDVNSPGNNIAKVIQLGKDDEYNE